MKATYKGPAFTIDHDASDLKEAFAFIGRCDEIFAGAEACQNCQGIDLRPKYSQTAGGYEYYSLVCHVCKWEFRFGQRKSDGGLYPKGWEPPFQKEGQQPQQQPAPAQAKAELLHTSQF